MTAIILRSAIQVMSVFGELREVPKKLRSSLSEVESYVRLEMHCQ